MQTLEDICSALPQRPHPNPINASKEHNQYAYTCAKIENNIRKTANSIEVKEKWGTLTISGSHTCQPSLMALPQRLMGGKPQTDQRKPT